MQQVNKNTIARLEQIGQKLLELQEKISNQTTEFNELCKEKYTELIGDPTEEYDRFVEEFNDLRQTVQAQQQTFFEAQPNAWQESEDGRAYQAWMEAWEYGDLDEYDIGEFEELLEPSELGYDDIKVPVESPGDIEYAAEDVGERAAQSMKRQKQLEAWKKEVVSGKTTLGFTAWQMEQMAGTEASE